MSFVISALTIIIRIIYGPLKLLHTKRRVVFLSRQSDQVSVDFSLVADEIRKQDQSIEVVLICNRFRHLGDGAIRFSYNLLRSMYYLATSRVCVLDAYWPAVSLLKHKQQLTIIQLWHSIGKIKKSGYQTVGKKGGRSSKLAHCLYMHKNYNYIIAGGRAWNKYYCEAFNIQENQILNYGLPRLDIMTENINKESLILEKYSELQGKIIVFYAPTYRKYEIQSHKELKEVFRSDKYAFIYRLHPNQKTKGLDPTEMKKYEEEDTFSLIRMCDYFITDYSSLALEAAMMNKKTYYYLFDYGRYSEENGLNINLYEVMPHCTFETGMDILEAVDEKTYPYEELVKYREMFLPEELGKSTEKITKFIMEKLH